MIKINIQRTSRGENKLTDLLTLHRHSSSKEDLRILLTDNRTVQHFALCKVFYWGRHKGMKNKRKRSEKGEEMLLAK